MRFHPADVSRSPRNSTPIRTKVSEIVSRSVRFSACERLYVQREIVMTRIFLVHLQQSSD